MWSIVQTPWCGPVFTPHLSHVTTDTPTALHETFVKHEIDVKDTVLALSAQGVFDAHEKGRLVKIDTEPDF